MARLNEPPAVAPAIANTAAQPGAESVDAVKRRFIRQNRELAKNNSNQSLRIRSLEIEVSRLQADNLDLRERILQLENELSGARSGQVSGDAVQRVRAELQAKLAELSGLVDGIDALAHASEDPATSLPRARRPLEGHWRERQPLTEAMRENQMPTISEDKQYPRRTLGADEIQAIRLSDHSSNESPDLGPPPIAHFDYEDPIKHASPSANRPSPRTAENDEELPASMSVNLETRRRRKDGQPKLEIRRHSIVSQSPVKTDAETSTILRTGAKRKLADRDLDRPIKPPAKGDFTFSRKAPPSDAKAATEHSVPPAVERTAEIPQDVSATPPKPTRRVLGDKSVNMSPRKAPLATDKVEKEVPEKVSKPVGPRSASVTARRRRASAIPQPLQHDEILPSVEIAPPVEPQVSGLPPKTPAPTPDLFSPTPSETSAARPVDDGVRAGTPPPADLSTLSIATDGGMRPSRRARAAVNYTEPSLNSKIRRPGKGMVDAVTGLVDPRRAMSATAAKREVSVPRTVVVKREPVDDEDEAWRNLPPAQDTAAPGSPLETKTLDSGSGEALRIPTEDLALCHNRLVMDTPSAASATISALMAGGRQRRRRESGQLLPAEEPLGTDLAAKVNELDIYDFKESSSPAGDYKPAGSAPGKSTVSHMRHSSVPKNMSSAALPERARSSQIAEGKAPVSGVGVSPVPAVEVSRSERAASRRRSMML